MAAYIAALFAVAFVSGRRTDNYGFFAGNRRSNWMVVTFAMISAAMSGVTFISVPGWVEVNNFSYLQMALGFIAGQLVIAFLLIPLYYRMQLVSIYEYLESRFDTAACRTGAWFFFISKMLGSAVKLFLVCMIMQMLVFGPLGIPFAANVTLTVLSVWLYTFRGGVRSLIWTDSLKTLCLLGSVGLCLYFIGRNLGLDMRGMVSAVAEHDYSRTFFFDDICDKRHFLKQFLGGMFSVIAMTGLDQDMMQRSLSCRNPRDAQKNVVISGVLQFFVIVMFVALGVLLFIYLDRNGMAHPANSDEVFPLVATGGGLPAVVGILFVLGLISSTYSSAGSALTALTTSFTVDILHASGGEEQVARTRKRVHAAMAAAMAAVILLFGLLNSTSVIDATFVLASYTYGPILGMFAFGILTRRRVRGRYIPIVAAVSPLLCYILQSNSAAWFGGYRFGYELLIVNALITMAGMRLLALPEKPSRR